MIITKLKATNIKGSDLDLELGPVTLITGPAQSGKTAIMDAIRLGLQGYHPKLGKRSVDTMDLASGAKMQVELTLSNDRSIVRTFERGKDPKGFDGDFVPPPMLDLSTYHKMSGPDRLRYVFEQCRIEELSHKAVAQKVLGLAPKEPNESTNAALVAAVNIVDELHAAREEEGASVQEWLEAILTRFTEERKQAADAVKQFEGLARGSAQIKAANGSGVAQSVAGEIKNLRATVATMRSEASVMQAVQMQNEARSKRVANLTGILGRLADPTPEISSYESELSDLQKKFDCPLVYNVELLEKQCSEFRSELSVLQERRSAIKASAKEIQDAVAEVEGLSQCPYCKSKSGKWQKNLLEQYAKELDELVSQVKATELQLDLLQKRVKPVTEQREAASKEYVGRLDIQNRMAVLRSHLQPFLKIKNERAAYLVELETLQSQEPKPVDLAALQTLQESIKASEQQIDDLEAKERQYIAARATEAQALQARALHEEQTARAQVFKLAAEQIRELQQAMIDKAIGGLMSVARQFTDGILPGKLDYRDGEVGYETDAGTWVKMSRTFSGTETAIAFAGFAVALSQSSPLKIVLIDELGITDRKFEIARRLVELQGKGVIDQAVLVDVGNDPGWQALDRLTRIEVAR